MVYESLYHALQMRMRQAYAYFYFFFGGGGGVGVFSTTLTILKKAKMNTTHKKYEFKRSSEPQYHQPARLFSIFSIFYFINKFKVLKYSHPFRGKSKIQLRNTWCL